MTDSPTRARPESNLPQELSSCDTNGFGLDDPGHALMSYFGANRPWSGCRHLNGAFRPSTRRVAVRWPRQIRLIRARGVSVRRAQTVARRRRDLVTSWTTRTGRRQSVTCSVGAQRSRPETSYSRPLHHFNSGQVPFECRLRQSGGSRFTHVLRDCQWSPSPALSPQSAGAHQTRPA
jgi:hypothetical protein